MTCNHGILFNNKRNYHNNYAYCADLTNNFPYEHVKRQDYLPLPKISKSGLATQHLKY